MPSWLFEILVIAVLIVLNGLLVAAEYALVTVRRSRLQQLSEEGNEGAKRVDRLIAQPTRFLAVLQLGVTFVGFLAAAFAGQSTAQSLSTWMQGVGFSVGQANIISLL